MMETHLMTPDLLPACDVEDIEAGRRPADRRPEGVLMAPASLAETVTCPRCAAWVHA